jgi:Zn-dependent metalloprotease
MQYRSILAASATTVLAASLTFATAGASEATSPAAQDAAAADHAGSFALSGEQAREYQLPNDVREVFSTSLPGGLTQTRYQQMVGDASVFGGQITVIKGADGQNQAVVGAYFPGLEPKNEKAIGKAKAREIVEQKVGSRGVWDNELRIDPRTGHEFYQVQSMRAASRPVRWVDAGSGHITKSFNALMEGEGTGVKGDTKTIDTTKNASTGLWELKTGDDRQETYDLENKTSGGVLMTDADDVWDLDRGAHSPSQPAGVDAHYYAGVVDDFYGEVFNRDSIDGNGMKIISKVHYSHNYCNAFWNGLWMTYGDGDNRTCIPLSGGLDVDGHEMTHGVTEHTSGLIYENESGALNDSFSDMMGNTMEFYAAANGLDPAAEPDWLIGEDIMLDGTANPGFRNMGDPEEDGDPSHYSQRYTGTSDNGGVHTNSGISNHAYYLAVNGGSNASCTANASHGVLLTEDCDVVVPAIGLDRARTIFYNGFTSLPEYANFCDARNATVATAGTDADAVGLAWDAVGVHDGCAPGTPPPPPCEGSADAQLPIESPHPYGNNGDCTWTYDNGTAGFSFHFSLLDMEKDYDYVYVKDANGNVLASYTGTNKKPNGFDSPCIPTSTGSVQMTSDAAVTAQGFTIDAVNPC